MRIFRFASVTLSLSLAACSTFGGSSSSASGTSGGFLQSLNPFGASGFAPAAAIFDTEKKIDCPTAGLRDGGAVLRNGKGQAVTSQMTIRTVVRECAEDGSGLIVKVGIEGVAVIGAAGKPGPISGPITITVDRDGKAISSRATSAKANIGADGNAIFSLVEEGIKIPAGDGDTVITVGFKN